MKLLVNDGGKIGGKNYYQKWILPYQLKWRWADYRRNGISKTTLSQCTQEIARMLIGGVKSPGEL